MEVRQAGYNAWTDQNMMTKQMRMEDLAPSMTFAPIKHELKVGSLEQRMEEHIGQAHHSIDNQGRANGGQMAPVLGYGAPSAGSIIRGLQDLAPSHEQQRMSTLSPTSASDTAMPKVRKDTSRPVSRDQPHSASSSVTPSLQQPTTPQPPSNRQTPTIQSSTGNVPPQPFYGYSSPSNQSTQVPGSKRDSETAAGASGSPQQPTRKRARHDEPPIFARKASRTTNNNPLLPNKRQNGPRSGAPIKQEPKDVKPALSQTSVPATIKEESNGHPPPPPTNEVALPKAQPELAGQGPLGPWEPSILNLIPSEEVTRIISDFLFTQVVLRDDVGAGPAGGGPGQGAVLEIEAKIGQLIDKNTNDRLRLPIMSECVISKDDPNLRTQHRALNGFLNKALVDSQPPKQPTAKGAMPPKPRIPMSYVHTKECDAFYELSQAGHLALPPSIRAQINPRHRAKVRITTDQKTGKELAKIVKARVADLDIYSPRTAFDWRVSVNLEMNYDGDMRDLVETTEGGKRADRNKDRMSYTHLAYQIDLTQVTPFESTSKADKEHELEIEVSSAEVRKQGLLVKARQVSQYEDLIRGFVDNVRVLARHCRD
ncbi:mRNA-capping enzyme subunit beta [Acarospora aff. strigata]|nr:mRNA-capping enzyme subunit beta [Acarospora aff. strigata]